MWFYKIEHDNKMQMVKIIWNTKITYLKNFLVFKGIIACLFNNIWIGTICLLALAILLSVYLYRYGDLIQILRVQEKNNKIKYIGSKYSFKNPFVVFVEMSALSC